MAPGPEPKKRTTKTQRNISARQQRDNARFATVILVIVTAGALCMVGCEKNTTIHAYEAPRRLTGTDGDGYRIDHEDNLVVVKMDDGRNVQLDKYELRDKFYKLQAASTIDVTPKVEKRWTKCHCTHYKEEEGCITFGDCDWCKNALIVYDNEHQPARKAGSNRRYE